MDGLRSLAWVTHALAWELRRLARAFWRRFGAAGVATVVFVVLAGIAMWLDRNAHAEKDALQRELIVHRTGQPLARLVKQVPGDEGRARLAEFDRYLPPHDEIPQAVGDLLTLAEREGLLAEKGDYRVQPDPQGGFLRYRMTLPVKGDAAAVRRFVLAALEGQKTLALESVQFKREQAGDAQIEARIQWLLFARLPQPAQPAMTLAGHVSQEGRR